MTEGNYTFAGIGTAEAKTRHDEYRTGVPPLGQRLLALLSAPIRQTTDLKVMNQGNEACDVRLAHGSGTRTVAGELLAALGVSTTVYRGQLQFGSVVPGSVTIGAAAGPVPLTDVNPITGEGDGNLWDAGGVKRGTINYLTGVVDITFAGAVTEPVTAGYQHTDWVQFAFAQVTSHTAPGGTGTGGTPEVIQTTFGRIVPGTIAFTDGGGDTFVDDGKGNIIETTGGSAAVVGTVDYATGVITVTDAGLAVTGTFNVTYSFNPFGALLVAGGSTQDMNLLSPDIPEIGSESYADGIKGESRLALVGMSRSNRSTHLMTQWGHHVDDPYRVDSEYSGFPAGGASNDPTVDQGF